MPTTRIPSDFKEFLKSLDAHNARFLLMGGYAVNAFGYVRNTVDREVGIGRELGYDKGMQSLKCIDIHGESDQFSVDLLRLGGGHTFSHVEGLAFDFIDKTLGEVKWFLLQEQFESTRSLRFAEIEATPEQLTAFGFKLEDLVSAGWA
jgi:hypothetical protein